MAAADDQPHDDLIGNTKNNDDKQAISTAETSESSKKLSREPSPNSAQHSPRSRHSSSNNSLRNSSCDRHSQNGSDTESYQPTGPLRQCLLVAGLTPHVTKAHVAEIFGIYDTVLSVTLGKSKHGVRYAYVEMDSSAGASEAASSTNYGQIDGRVVGVTSLADQSRVDQLLEVGVSSPAAAGSSGGTNRRSHLQRSGGISGGRDPHRRPYPGLRSSGNPKDRDEVYNGYAANGRLPSSSKNNESRHDAISPRRNTAQSSRRNSPTRWTNRNSNYRPVDSQRPSHANTDRRDYNNRAQGGSPVPHNERPPSPLRRQPIRRNADFDGKQREIRERPSSRRRRISHSSPSQSPDPSRTRNNKRRISDEDHQRRDAEPRRPPPRRRSDFDEREGPSRSRSESPINKKREIDDGRKWAAPSREASPSRRLPEERRYPPPSQKWRNHNENDEWHGRNGMRGDRNRRSPSPRKRTKENYRDGPPDRERPYYGRDQMGGGRGRRSPPPQHNGHQTYRSEFKGDIRSSRGGGHRRESHYNGRSRAREDIKNGDDSRRSPRGGIRSRSMSPEYLPTRTSPRDDGFKDGNNKIGRVDKLRREESSDSDDRHQIQAPSGRSGRRGIQVRGAVGRPSRGGRMSLCGTSDSSDAGNPSDARNRRRSRVRDIQMSRSPPPLTSLKSAASRRPRSPSSSSNSLERIAKRRRS